ncbi:unnamed protein product [Vicia faba]|uniref:NnrU domain-containing protein n=1 Tax=Vicia faba TaxID=3906 RepID=A0AAV1B8B4_VICFA|nr:unnamed protein product [Vicia faba]
MASTPLVFSTSFSSKLHLTSHTNKSHPHHPLLNSFPSSSPSSKSRLKFSSSNPLMFSPKLVARASSEEHATEVIHDSGFVGEDAATFHLDKQKLSSWLYFTAILGVVLFVLNLIWIDDSTGFGKVFVDTISGISDTHELVILVLILIFAGVHSGLASFRDSGEKLIGERAYRVLFAGTSLPLALTMIVYFINHRYDGLQLWQVQDVPGVHQLVWLSNFISFFFLYPSTFNLLEVAAVDKPKLHLYETGIMRITRHPQMVGQVMWCLGHTVWIGNSVAVAASFALIAHHLFGVWNGDRKLSDRYGEDFEMVKGRTSVVPFAAILDGRQKLPKDFYKEFIRLPYFTITAITLGAYFAHPLMRAASFKLHW